MACRAAVLALLISALAAAAGDRAAAILDQARGLPAEIFADIALRLVDGGQVAEKNRAALLDEVFLRAAEARDAVPLRPAPLSRPIGMRGVPNLDALSIRCRVVRSMLAVDGKRARDRFSQIAPPEASHPDCRSALIPDPTIYFDTLAEIVARAPFTADEQKKQVPFWMLESAVRGIRTSLEIVVAARAFPQMAHDQKQASALAAAFAVALDIDDGNRNFTAAARSANLVGAVLGANDKLAALGAPRAAILAGLRGYLVRHLGAPRCADSPVEDYARSLELFQAALGSQTVVLPISKEESTPAKSEGAADLPKPADLSGYQAILGDIVALLKDPAAAAAPEVLAKLRAWKGSDGQDAIEVFHQKARLYYRLLPSSPRAPLFAPALAGFIATLEDSAVLNASPADWLTEEVAIEGRAYNADFFRTAGSAAGPSYLPGGIAQAMADSNFPALSVSGRLWLLDHPVNTGR